MKTDYLPKIKKDSIKNSVSNISQAQVVEKKVKIERKPK